MSRSYSEMMKFDSYEERLNYLILSDGNVQSPREVSLGLYSSSTWKQFKKEIEFRDMGYDLGVFGVHINDKFLIHHINPLTEDDILNNSYKIWDPENVVLCSLNTHNIIHYGKPKQSMIERKPGDTKLW